MTLDAQLDGITWTKIDRNLRVEGWDHINLFDKVYLKLDLHQFLEKVRIKKVSVTMVIYRCTPINMKTQHNITY